MPGRSHISGIDPTPEHSMREAWIDPTPEQSMREARARGVTAGRGHRGRGTGREGLGRGPAGK